MVRIELVNNLHCEVYELQIDGIPVFNCTDYIQAEYEYRLNVPKEGPARLAT